MVYRTPCPPPEEPKMKEPFVWKAKHYGYAAYVAFLATVAIFVSLIWSYPGSLRWTLVAIGIGHALILLMKWDFKSIDERHGLR